VQAPRGINTAMKIRRTNEEYQSAGSLWGRIKLRGFDHVR
jgi:hypothetical protein